MREIDKQDILHLIERMATIKVSLEHLMELERPRGSEHNLKELTHHMEMSEKYINRITKENG